MARDGCDLQTAENRLAQQLPTEEIARRSKRVLVNDGTPEQLAAAIRQVLCELHLTD